MKARSFLSKLTVLAGICSFAAGCSRASAPYAAAEAAPAMVAAKTAASAAPAGSPLSVQGGSAVAPVPEGGRMVMSEVELSLRSKTPAAAAEHMSLAVSHAGGYVLSREESASEETVTRVAMVLRVPSAKLEDTLAELRKTGTVLGESRTGQDVTGEYSDTRAQLNAKQKLEERFLVVLGSAKTVKEMMEVEAELARVRGEADVLAGRARLLENRTALATIHVSIASPEQPVAMVSESVWSRFRNAFSESCTLAVQVTTGIIVVLGAVAPFLAPVALALFFVRRHRRATRRALMSA